MVPPIQPETIDKPELYGELAVRLRELLGAEGDLVANAANMAALLFHNLPDINWAGFYFLRVKELVLGPFQGRPAPMRILIGKGVCGRAVKRGESVLVDDVQSFEGYIEGDPDSRSELVVPLIDSGECLGVLVLDSTLPARFDEEDRDGCEALVGLFLAHQRAMSEPGGAGARRRGGH